ncbi:MULTISPECIES: winged helix-turn-helix transcriptional regulator [Bacillaceae]|nr:MULTISPECIES: winged helix-turn-helix transcriptional regulator [unclassified Bacillus (in: firmicutes)]PEC48631.1 hypothetical protein CON00_13660 [Bacillus sp. AFS096315]PFM82625.1 hypothetical protein COJ46_02090 [Bacillus sp. AFS077874]
MEYSLTELGKKFNTVLDAMIDWGTGFMKKKIEEITILHKMKNYRFFS